MAPSSRGPRRPGPRPAAAGGSHAMVGPYRTAGPETGPRPSRGRRPGPGPCHGWEIPGGWAGDRALGHCRPNHGVAIPLLAQPWRGHTTAGPTMAWPYYCWPNHGVAILLPAQPWRGHSTAGPTMAWPYRARGSPGRGLPPAAGSYWAVARPGRAHGDAVRAGICAEPGPPGCGAGRKPRACNWNIAW
jgi:hypothetical protein